MAIEDLIKEKENKEQIQRQRQREKQVNNEQNPQPAQNESPQVEGEEKKDEEVIFVSRNKSSFAGIKDIIIVLDESSSMMSWGDNVIKGYNTFLDSQMDSKNMIYITTTTFSDQIKHPVLRQSIEKARNIKYEPKGMTSLLDAIGDTIRLVSSSHLRLDSSNKSDEVVFAIITDGVENASTKYSHEQIKNMIEIQKRVNKWHFVFLGASKEVCQEGAKLGIDSSSNFLFSTKGDVGENIFTQLDNILSLDYKEEPQKASKVEAHVRGR